MAQQSVTSSRARIERVRKVFDNWAEIGRADGMERGHGPSARPAFDRLELNAGMQYLDVGCGNGYTVRWAADLVGDGKAIGIDVAPQMIERARAMTGARDNIEFCVTPFPEHTVPGVLSPGRFDGVFSMEVLYYLPDIGGALTQIQKLLRPGGRFACVVDYYLENAASHSWPDNLDCEMTLLGETQWREAFETAGLHVREQTRLRREPGAGVDDWKVSEGSLLTLGERPA